MTTHHIRRLPGQQNRKPQIRQGRGFIENSTDEGSALEELNLWVDSKVHTAILAANGCHSGRN
jgi:hypothetical protein